MEKKSESQLLKEKLMHKFESTWDCVSKEESNEITNFAEKYKQFLDTSKTEREAIYTSINLAKENGFQNIEDLIKTGCKLEPGMKIYANNKNKSLALFVIGNQPLGDGLNIIGAHVDAPRIDLKQFPLYEDTNIALLKTHYYGGIKKYQWTSLPLALHGFVVKSDGSKVDIVIGEKETDPVFMIADLLIHLSKDQMAKKLSEGITGENLNVIIGSKPIEDKEIEGRVKLNILNLLNETYGMTEEDFTSAEFEVVPAGKARDLGLDRSMIAAYGHDDRVCSYAAVEAVFDCGVPNRTVCTLLVDKEEVGSQGNTGMESRFFELMVSELAAFESDNYSELYVKRALANSKVLSGDVAAGLNPTFPEVLEKNNAAKIGNGLCLIKYTGARGKSGCNDANSEFMAEIRKIFNDNKVNWQLGELGKVDQGGGGTIAYILARYGMEVIDCGTPVLGMHSPYEIISKADLYMTYRGYKAFYKA